MKSKVKYFPCLFVIQRINSSLIKFETELVAIKTVKDLSVLDFMKPRARYCKGEVYSVELSEANILIANHTLKWLYKLDSIEKETEFFMILNKELGLLKI